MTALACRASALVSFHSPTAAAGARPASRARPSHSPAPRRAAERSAHSVRDRDPCVPRAQFGNVCVGVAFGTRKRSANKSWTPKSYPRHRRFGLCCRIAPSFITRNRLVHNEQQSARARLHSIQRGLAAAQTRPPAVHDADPVPARPQETAQVQSESGGQPQRAHPSRHRGSLCVSFPLLPSLHTSPAPDLREPPSP